MRIGELARASGVSTRTIRYYEELGILPGAKRTEGGTRVYTQEWRFFLEGARALKDVGFSLSEIRLLGRLVLHLPVSATGRREANMAVHEKIRTLEHRIRVLNRLHEILQDIGGRAEGATTESLTRAFTSLASAPIAEARSRSKAATR